MKKVILKFLSKKGSTLLETAFMLPFIFATLGMIIAGGQMVINKQVNNSAVYSAGRRAMLQTDLSTAKSEGKAVAVGALTSGLSMEKTVDLQIVPLDGAWLKGNRAEVTLTTSYTVVFPVAKDENPLRVGSQKKQVSKIVMMIEQN